MTKEITKKEFKKLCFKHEYCNRDYWNDFYGKEKDVKYYFTEPVNPAQTRMLVISESDQRRIILLTEDAEESFFSYPGKD